MRLLQSPFHALSRCALALALLAAPAIPARADSDAPAVTAANPAAAIAPEALPGWVRARAIPAATPARLDHAQEGIAYLLTDSQTRVTAQGHDALFRSAIKVVERSGLEQAGQVSVTFNPRFETVGVHFIHIIRDGKVIDLTGETHFRVVERENQLDDGIISGTLKAIANLRDVRVGDIVDYATTTHTRTTLWPGHFFDQISQRYSQPLAWRGERYVWADGMAGQYKALGSSIAFAVHKAGAATEWEWEETDPPAQQGENDVPGSAFQWGRVDVSTMGSWAQLAQWGAGLYVGDQTLPADFAAKLDAIAKANPAPADRLTEATRLVQDTIRYVGEEMGEGSYVPRRPAVVLQRGYGDCKDKALLLAVALRRLGIEAVPALVSTSRGSGLPQRLPSPLLFDHVIVRAVLDGKVLWLDATGTHRGGRGLDIVPSDLGYALPLREGQAAPEKMEGYGPHAGELKVLEQFAVDEAAPTALQLTVSTRYTGAQADGMRERLANRSAKTIARENLDFYRKRFVGLTESQPIEFADQRDANVLTMVEHYSLPHADFEKDKLLAKLVTRAYAVQDVLPERQSGPRVNPLALADHVSREQIIELNVNDRLPGLPADVDARAGDIAFLRHSERVGDGVRMTYRLTTGAREETPASGAEEVYAVSDKVVDEAVMEFYLDKSQRPSERKAQADKALPGGVDPALLAPLRADFDKAAQKLQTPGDDAQIEALGLLNGILEKLPHPSPTAGLVEGMKAGALAQLRRGSAALAVARSATAQFDGNPDVFRLWIALEMEQGDVPGVLGALRRTVQAQPQVVATLPDNWVRYIQQKLQALPRAERDERRYDLCIALADGGWQMQPRGSGGDAMLSCAIVAHALRGEWAAARSGLAQGPVASTLASLALDRRYQPLWSDLDKLGADGFRKSMERDLEAASAAPPRDPKALLRKARALRALGRNADAEALEKPLATDMGQVEVIGDDAFWLVNDYAEVLRDQGRVEEAVAAMDRALALGVDRYPSLVNLAINRLQLLDSAGRPQAVLDAAKGLEEKSAGITSVFGRMWIWAEMACAQRALGQTADAAATEAKMAEKADENRYAMARAAACRGNVAEIAETLVARLKSADTRSSVLDLFVVFGGPQVLSPFDQRLRQTMQAATQRPEVQAEFRKQGRAVRFAGPRSVGWNEF